MTLNFKAPGILAQIGFSVNEIASAMTIAHYAGAFFSRKFTELAKLVGKVVELG